MKRPFAAACLAALASTISVGCLASGAPEATDVQSARAAYRECALLKLPAAASAPALPRARAEAAVEGCGPQRLALAGHYALAHPGSRDVEQFSGQAWQALVEELAGAISDLESRNTAAAR